MKIVLLSLSFFMIVACGKTTTQRGLNSAYNDDAVAGVNDKKDPNGEDDNEQDLIDQCKKLGNKWEGGECVKVDEMPDTTVEDNCIDAGGTFENGSCKFPDPLEEAKEKCEAEGGTWTNDICVKVEKPDPPMTPEPPKVKNGGPILLSKPELLYTYVKPDEGALNLSVEIRDFKSGHADFENSNFSEQLVTKNLVEPTLNAMGNPVFAGTDGTQVTNKASFDQWYVDIPTVNMRVNENIKLTKVAGTNIYEYDNQAFFPIDNKGFKNEGNEHNYHFTLKGESVFTYQGGEKFTFIGDDDLWVFIDNKLVIDLGGVHNKSTQTVDVDTLGLTLGKDYRFSLFFAERMLVESHFKIQTSIKLKTNAPYEYDVQAQDPEKDILTYGLADSPDGMKIDPQTGKITWQPGAADVGEHPVIVTVDDGQGNVTKQEYKITVEEVL